MTYSSRVNDDGLVVIDYSRSVDAGVPLIVVGSPSDLTRMWAAWFAEKLHDATDGPPAWPFSGLQFFDSPDQILFVFDGLPVGLVVWTATTWMWSALNERGARMDLEAVDVDPQQSAAFNLERQRVAMSDPSVTAVHTAELDGRIRLFRDETRELAVMFGRSKSRRRGLSRRTATAEV